MLRLITIEYHKLKYSKSAKVLTIGYFILLLAIALLSIAEIPYIKIRLADQGIFNFPYIWHFNTWFASILKFFLAVVIVSMTANEYSNRTLKQNLIDGLSKKEFILSKFFTVIVFSALSTLFIFVLSIILGYSFSDFTEFSIVTQDLEYLLAFFIKLVGFFSFCLFLGILVKKSAYALGFLLFWYIFEKIIWLFLLWLNRDVEGEGFTDQITQLLPLESFYNLIEEPITRLNFMKTAASQLNADIVSDYSLHWYEVGISSVWIFLFIYGSFTLLKKRDL